MKTAPLFICVVTHRSGRLASIASGVVTQENTPEDSNWLHGIYVEKPLSLSVSPQERATATARMDILNAKMLY